MTIRVAAFALALTLVPNLAFAHCDTQGGPVVTDAKQALALRDLTPVLKWLKAADEAEVRRVFDQTVNVRELSPAARELADRFFFETVVRLHRADEGAPYTGLRDQNPEPAIRLTDEALSSGSHDTLVQALNDHLKTELTRRFDTARAAKSKAASSVEAGRQYVSAYVELTHFVERVHSALLAPEAHAHSHE